MASKMLRIFYDTETTGLNHKKHSIVQLSGYIEINNVIQETFDFKIKPHPKAKLDPGALKVIGKTEEELMAYTDQAIIFRRFRKMLNSYIDRFDPTDKAWLIGYNNARFDDFFLRTFFELNNDTFFGSYFWVDTLDVMVLASLYLAGDRRRKMSSFKLFRVAEELGIVVEEDKLHNSLYDVELTRKIFRIVTGLELEI